MIFGVTVFAWRQTRPLGEWGRATATSWPFWVVICWIGPAGRGPTGGAEATAGVTRTAAAASVPRTMRTWTWKLPGSISHKGMLGDMAAVERTIRDEAELREVIGAPADVVVSKIADRLNP